jgi:hypothetical protein
MGLSLASFFVRFLCLGWLGGTHVKLPPLDALACVLVGDDDDELGDLAANHPLIELGHNLLDIGLDLIVGRDWRWGGALLAGFGG